MEEINMVSPTGTTPDCHEEVCPLGTWLHSVEFDSLCLAGAADEMGAGRVHIQGSEYPRAPH